MPGVTIFANPPATSFDVGPYVLVNWRDTTGPGGTGGWYFRSDLASGKEYKSDKVARKAADRLGGNVVVRPVAYIKDYAAPNPQRRSRKRQYKPATRYSDEELARLALADELNDARASLRFARELRAGADPRHYGMTVEQYEESARQQRAKVRAARGRPTRNPSRGRGQVVSRRVYEVRYRHVQKDAKGRRDFRHTFRPGVCAELLPDGSVRLYHKDGKPLMREY